MKEKYPEKFKATLAVSNAVYAGKLKRKPCEKCGTEKNVQAHHEDYSKPLDVNWLCVKHHRMLHGTLLIRI